MFVNLGQVLFLTLSMLVCSPRPVPFCVFTIYHCHVISTSIFVFHCISYISCLPLITQGQRDGEVEEEKREKPKATFEGEKLKELTEGEADVISDVINPNGLPVQNGLDVDVKEFGYDIV